MIRYAKPTTVDEALALLREGPWRILAGGTDVYPAQGTRPFRDDILDINGLAELDGIGETATHWLIGARTSWTSLVRHPLPAAFDVVKQAGREVGSAQIQNVGTIAGNLCNASPAADGVPALLALDADVELRSAVTTRHLPLREFVLGVRRTALRPDEMVTAIRVPKGACRGASAFLKLGARRYLVISIAMVATRRMDHAMTRPFTKEHAGAYNRAQRDPRYQVSAKTIERVEAKRQRRIDGQTLVANGDAIGAAWQTTATAMRTVGVTGLALTAAQAIGKNLLRYRDGQAGKGTSDPVTDRRETSERGQKSFLSHPGMRELNALIGDIDMAQTPLEMRQKMDRVNKALDGMSETLPETERGRFEQYREDVNDKMHDRLARLQFEAEQQRKAGASGAGEPTPEREARGRDLPTREDAREPETPRREADAARSRQQQNPNKEKVRQAEEQDRRNQRSNDNDYER